jgi:hypothetical protein
MAAATDSSAASSGTIEKTISAARATAAGSDAASAPSRTSASTRAASRSQTASRAPARIRLREIGVPMRPTPMKPSRAPASGAIGTLLRRSA